MRTRRQAYTADAHWRGNHWELHLHHHGTTYLAPDDDFDTHLHHYLNTIGHYPHNPTFHIHYPQAQRNP